jgi:hypothetical protein
MRQMVEDTRASLAGTVPLTPTLVGAAARVRVVNAGAGGEPHAQRDRGACLGVDGCPVVAVDDAAPDVDLAAWVSHGATYARGNGGGDTRGGTG